MVVLRLTAVMIYKKAFFLLAAIIIITSCGTSKPKSYPDYVLGVEENTKTKKFYRDSLNVVTPSIEIYIRVNKTSHPKYDDRELVKNFVIETLKLELPKSEYYELNLMSKDYSTVNKALEIILSKKHKNPEWIVAAPNEILISESKYTLLISITGSYGDSYRGVLFCSVINNKDKIIEYVERYTLNGSPLNKNKIQKRIKKAIAEIVYKQQYKLRLKLQLKT